MHLLGIIEWFVHPKHDITWIPFLKSVLDNVQLLAILKPTLKKAPPMLTIADIHVGFMYNSMSMIHTVMGQVMGMAIESDV